MTLPAGTDQAGQLVALYNAIGSVNEKNAIPNVVTSAAQVLPDPTVAAYNTATLATSSASTFQLPAASLGKRLALLLTQDGTGSRTAAFTTSVGALTWVGGAPTLTTTAGRADLLKFECYDGVNWIGSPSLNIH